MTLKLQFDPNQDYQLDAIQSVVQLFDGLPRRDGLSETWLFDNLRQVQERNRVQPDQLRFDLATESGLGLVGERSYRYPSFTIEMETGTGKTYVYLRSE